MTVEARRFAIRMHGEQQYGPHPYQYHLALVAEFVTKYVVELTADPVGADHGELVAAAWLHDVLEDTNATISMLHRAFGSTVTALVVAVTDEPGNSRAERHAKTYPRIRAVGMQAVGLKLCDRLANVQASIELDGTKMLNMYRAEHPDFVAALHRPGELSSLWAELGGQL